MHIIKYTCGACGGFGHHHVWEIVSEGIAERKEVTCTTCKGNGYLKYVGFSIDEAKAIMKHCGLSTEELED